MEYCARCVYPANAKPTIIFDDEGICSGCRHHDARHRINWAERERMLRELFAYYKDRARSTGQLYDCIVPVSGVQED